MKLIRVRGDSMSPTLRDGDYVLTIRPRHILPGLICVIDHGDLGTIIKRIERVEDGYCYARGDNTASTPAALIGKIQTDRIRARAIYAISKTGLRRLS